MSTFCGHCGEAVAGRDHGRCAQSLALEPPRFCSACRRRMKVQVTPRGWSAACVEHGVVGVG
ncbi:hypothetical protein [Nocardioides zeae]|uniref:Biotin synthase auxiliary protein n=1 Tax=Nocardioides zeae TaxID=1457234 RepID=A0A6P0HGI3_9ACTN|nr:hypothetical protein [Nocardioides zeae]NEN77414.1 hypothetical protein [Nocardioides zeae]